MTLTLPSPVPVSGRFLFKEGPMSPRDELILAILKYLQYVKASTGKPFPHELMIALTYLDSVVP